MPFAAAISEHPLPTHAVGEVVGQVLDQLGEAPDAALVFVTAPFGGAMEDIAATIRATLRPGALIGATADAVLGPGREVEGGAAISLFALRAGAGTSSGRPGAPRAVVLPAPGSDVGGMAAIGLGDAGVGTSLVVLADPFAFPVDGVLEDLDARTPGLAVVGGLASGATGPGGNRLVADDQILSEGAVGLVLPPPVVARAVVSQGCRPVGEPLVVTRSHGPMIEEIAGMPALDRLLAQAAEASPEDRSRMARGLQLGIAVDERRPELERGDFLIRPVLGADHQQRAVAVGAEVAVGTTVQFHVRDAEAADEDLRHLLLDQGGRGALVFSCSGRGTHLFDEPHHDAGVVSDHLDGGPVAGMFCAGEIGPVGGRHLVHAMSAAVLLLDDP